MWWTRNDICRFEESCKVLKCESRLLLQTFLRKLQATTFDWKPAAPLQLCVEINRFHAQHLMQAQTLFTSLLGACVFVCVWEPCQEKPSLDPSRQPRWNARKLVSQLRQITLDRYIIITTPCAPCTPSGRTRLLFGSAAAAILGASWNASPLLFKGPVDFWFLSW